MSTPAIPTPSAPATDAEKASLAQHGLYDAANEHDA